MAKHTCAILFVLLSLAVSGCKVDEPFPEEKRNCNTAVPKNDTIVLLVMGQSNAANYGDAKYSPHCNNIFDFYKGTLSPLNDPLQGASGASGSVWSRLADKLIERNFAGTVIVVPCAVGGTKIEQWIPGGNLNYLVEETLGYLDNAGLKPTHVLWHQGESNHVAFSTGGITPQQNADNYTANFGLLVNYLRSKGVAAPVYPAMATICQNAPDTVLQNAQRNLTNPSRQIFNGPNTDSLGGEYRYDNCHFNDAGLNKHADLWVDVLTK